jgi:methyl-accepting chemotaxis protein
LHLLKTTRSLKSEFFQLFDLVSQMDETRGSIVEDASVIKEFVRKVKFLAFNASTSAQRLGAVGRTLAVVAQQMQVNSAESAKSAQNFGNSMAKSLEAQEAITFEVAAALLETETLELFICEALECLHNITTCNRSQLNYKIKVLGQALDRGVKTSAKHSRLVNDAVAQFKVSNENLHEMISQAGLVHVTAKVETSAISDPSNLHVIFSDLRASVDSAEKAISRLIGATTKTATDLYEMLDAEARVEDLARSAKDTIANIDQS